MTYLLLKESISLLGLTWPAGPMEMKDIGWARKLTEAGRESLLDKSSRTPRSLQWRLTTVAKVTLATLDQIKSRLRLPSGTTSQDDLIDAYREAAEEAILNATGFSFVSSSSFTDTLTDWQRGTTRITRYRPVLTLTNVEGRVLGTQATFNQLLGDIKNAFDGRILLVGYLNAFYDPRAGYGAAYGGGTWENWYKWREYAWPIIRMTYTIDPLGSDTNPIPKALTAATIETVAYMISRPAGAGPLTSVSVESVSESYGQGAKAGLLPPVAMALIARYNRQLAVMQT